MDQRTASVLDVCWWSLTGAPTTTCVMCVWCMLCLVDSKLEYLYYEQKKWILHLPYIVCSHRSRCSEWKETWLFVKLVPPLQCTLTGPSSTNQWKESWRTRLNLCHHWNQSNQWGWQRAGTRLLIDNPPHINNCFIPQPVAGYLGVAGGYTQTIHRVFE